MFRMFKEGVDDLVMCPHPSNSELTKQLGARFDRELMYTNISDVLISVNPYKSLPITGEEFIKMYQNSAGSHDVPPHIYHLAERAYRRLVDDKESQCVIISGESGAGKTVAAKLILNYITTVSPSVSSGSGSSSSSSSSSSYSSSSSSSSSSYEPPSSSRPEPPSARGGARGRARGGGLSSSAGGAGSRASYGVSESSSSSAPSSPYGGGSRPTPPAASGRPSPPSPAAAYTPPAPAPVRASPPAATYGAPPPATYGAPPPAVRGAPPPAVRGAPPPAVRGAPPPPFGAPPRGGGRAGAQGPAGSRLRSGGRDVETIKKIIIDSNPVMEAFGNAKTVRNDNSSRFGKYLEIQFSDNSAPVGGVMSTFLLEKSRVAYQQKGERNFHIFYQLLAGISQYNPSMMDEFGLNRSASSFHYLSQGQCTTIEDVDDRAEFMVVTSAMRTIGFTDNEMDSMFQILAAILHLGDIQFEGETLGRVRNREALEFAAFLLGVDGSYLEMSLNHKSIQSGSARGTQFNVPQNAFQAGGIRDALSKTLYSRVFDFIVAKINSSMVYSGKTNVIGVLDIYGFEIFERNSFEQFCINYVNERLQQIFIDLTVRGEQKEYHDEGLKWKDISFFDNKVVCELIEAKAPPGIFRVLDDTCKTAHALDSNTVDGKFLERLIRQFADNQYIEFPSGTGAGATQFTIKHYAGDVTYDIDEFCFKNNDNLYISLVQCMQTSSVSFIVSLFPENLANDKSTPSTAGFKIRESANYLVKRLSACTPHYIRCIKSNDKKLPMTFNESRVEHQVKYLGLLENVKVKRSGYAYRHFTDVFVQRFGPICDTPPTGFKDFLAQIGRKYKDIDVAEFEEGKTKVFVRTPETIFTLEEILFRVTDPEGYAARVKAYKESERIAQAKQGKHGLKQKCSLM